MCCCECMFLLSTLNVRMLGFEYVNELYMNDGDFANIFNACEYSTISKFYRLDRYLLKKNHLCVPLSSMHELLVRESYKDGLI